jgi:hypothetical protein
MSNRRRASPADPSAGATSRRRGSGRIGDFVQDNRSAEARERMEWLIDIKPAPFYVYGDCVP